MSVHLGHGPDPDGRANGVDRLARRDQEPVEVSPRERCGRALPVQRHDRDPPFGTIRLEGLRQRAAAAVDEDEVQLVQMPCEAVEGGGIRADHTKQHVSGSRLPWRTPARTRAGRLSARRDERRRERDDCETREPVH